MQIFNTTYLYLNQKITDFSRFDIQYKSSKIVIKDGKSKIYQPDATDIFSDYDHNPENVFDTFKVLYAYSIDNIDFSEYVDNLQSIIPSFLDSYYISVKFEPINPNTYNQPTIYKNRNVDKVDCWLFLESISYNGDDIDICDKNLVKFITQNDIINQYPKWNLYDNQNVTIKRFIAQCNALLESYGHNVIYFKTDFDETNNTLRQNHERSVVSMKRIPIMINGNDIGQVDKLIYSEWDMPLQDDFEIHIVWDRFKLAFGDDAIPNDKDYLYMPLLNKMFKITAVQPVNSIMGKIVWFQANLMKFEDDSSIKVPQELADDELTDEIPEFAEIFETYETGDKLNISGNDVLTPQYEGNILEQIKQFEDVSLHTKEKIGIDTVQTKRDATEYYTNKLVDSTGYISLKESEKFRQYYYKRLKIVEVNPDTSLFPVTMYDNTTVKNNVVAIQYKLSDFTEISKVSTTVDTGFVFSMNFVITDKLRDISLIDLLNERGDFIHLSFISEDNKLYISNAFDKFLINYEFEIKEFYNIEIGFKNIDRPHYFVKIYKLDNKLKTLVYQNIYSVNGRIPCMKLGYLHLFGGKFLSNEITLLVNDKNIFTDFCNPILIMNTKR